MFSLTTEKKIKNSFSAAFTNTKLALINTERGGFEPPMKFTPHNSLAGSRFQPLSHLSKFVGNTLTALSILNYNRFNLTGERNSSIVA